MILIFVLHCPLPELNEWVTESSISRNDRISLDASQRIHVLRPTTVEELLATVALLPSYLTSLGNVSLNSEVHLLSSKY
jgi:hypothetical protein